MLGVVTSQSDPVYTAGASGYLYAVYNAGSAYSLKANGSAATITATTAVTPQAGDLMRLRRAGGTWVAEVARAADPTAWTTIYTFGTTNNNDVWCAVSVNNGSGSSKTRGPLTGGNVV